MPPPLIPAATYRLQFNASFTFEAATASVDYLYALGISHCYASSYLAAVPASTHGYDVTDPTRFNPEARLNVLSELPGAWKQSTSRWARANRQGRSMIDGQSYPSRNEEYLLYQTLVGTWPFNTMTGDEERHYRDRIVMYMQKAMREAKVFTSWLNPSGRHERAMTRFVELALAPDNAAFLADFMAFQRRVAHGGIYNSLAQLAVKIVAPGVPDFYLAGAYGEIR